MKLRLPCKSAKLDSPRFDTRLEERPAEREKHQLCVRLAARRAPVRFVDQSHGILGRERFELLADQAYAHVDLLQPCQPLKEVSERCCVLHSCSALLD